MSPQDSILRLVRECGPMTFAQIAQTLGWGRPKVTYHVNCLRDRFLIARAGKRMTGHFLFEAVKNIEPSS